MEPSAGMRASFSLPLPRTYKFFVANVQFVIAICETEKTHYGSFKSAKKTASGKILPEGFATVVVYTNTFGKASLTVDKKWTDVNGNPANAPENASIKVTLTRNGEPTDNYAILDAASGWTHTFENLPLKDADGKAYEYYVVESEYDGYTSSYSKVENGRVIITNQKNETPPPPPTTTTTTESNYVSAEVTKVWVGGDENARPDSIEVQLYQNGVAYGSPVELSAANNWHYSWGQTLASGSSYTVSEVNVPEGYESSVTSNGARSFTITNTYTPDIPDDNTPLSPGEPNEPPTEINEPEIPLAPGEPVTIEEPKVPLAPAAPEEPTITIDESEVPLDDAPQTGDDSMTSLWALLSVLSLMGLVFAGAAVFVIRRREDR